MRPETVSASYCVSANLNTTVTQLQKSVKGLPRMCVIQDGESWLHILSVFNSDPDFPVVFKQGRSHYADFVEDISYLMAFVDDLLVSTQHMVSVAADPVSLEAYQQTVKLLENFLDGVLENGYVSLGKTESPENDVIVGRLKKNEVIPFMEQMFRLSYNQYVGADVTAAVTPVVEAQRVNRILKHLPAS